MHCHVNWSRLSLKFLFFFRLWIAFLLSDSCVPWSPWKCKTKLTFYLLEIRKLILSFIILLSFIIVLSFMILTQTQKNTNLNCNSKLSLFRCCKNAKNNKWTINEARVGTCFRLKNLVKLIQKSIRTYFLHICFLGSFCGQSYKASTIVIYDSTVVYDLKIPHITTLDS